MSNTTWDFSDRAVVITGSAVGIGAAAVGAFSSAGATVFGLDIDEDGGQKVAAETGSTFVRCDITSSSEVRQAMATAAGDESRIDVLINNAGGFWEQNTTETLSEQEWDRVVDVNLKSVFLCAQSALEYLRSSANGRIITVSSLAAQTALYRSSPPYAAAKAGAIALGRVLAYELAGDGITSNVIAPSAVMTDRVKAVRSPEERAKTAASIPLGRYGEPDDIVAWMLFLASAESGYMTGETLTVNGGRFMS